MSSVNRRVVYANGFLGEMSEALMMSDHCRAFASILGAKLRLGATKGTAFRSAVEQSMTLGAGSFHVHSP